MRGYPVAALPGYEYLRNGALAKERMPTGREITWSYDDGGRPVTAADASKSYVSAVVYTDHDAVAQMMLDGYHVRARSTYDPNRLQITGQTVERCGDNSAACGNAESLLALGYGYTTWATAGNLSGPDNNGNVRSQDISVGGGFRKRKSYSYL